MAKRNTQEPWERSNPRKKTAKTKGSRKLTSGQKAEARGRARKAGRKYPNLVDNMAVARKKSATKTSAKKRSAKKGTATKRSAKKNTAKKSAAKQRPARKRTAKRSTKGRTTSRKRR